MSSFIRRPRLYRLVLAQCLVACAIAMLCGLFGANGFGWDSASAYSALLGGLICCLPSWYFMMRAFQYRGARAMPSIVTNMFKAQAHKFLLVGVLFGLVFKYVEPLEPVTLFIGFISVQVVHAFSGILAKL